MNFDKQLIAGWREPSPVAVGRGLACFDGVRYVAACPVVSSHDSFRQNKARNNFYFLRHDLTVLDGAAHGPFGRGKVSNILCHLWHINTGSGNARLSAIWRRKTEHGEAINFNVSRHKTAPVTVSPGQSKQGNCNFIIPRPISERGIAWLR